MLVFLLIMVNLSGPPNELFLTFNSLKKCESVAKDIGERRALEGADNIYKCVPQESTDKFKNIQQNC